MNRREALQVLSGRWEARAKEAALRQALRQDPELAALARMGKDLEPIISRIVRYAYGDPR